MRVIRLQGPVSREIAAQADAADEAAERSGAFARPLLFDFKDATECDSVTLGYMIRALRRRMAAQAQVGIINAPPQLVAELEIAKLDRLLHVFASEDQALAELAVLSH